MPGRPRRCGGCRCMVWQPQRHRNLWRGPVGIAASGALPRRHRSRDARPAHRQLSVHQGEGSVKMYRPGDPLYFSFGTQDGTGAATNADALPAATLRRNGASTTVAVTVTNNAAGDYTAAAAIPAAWSGGDVLELAISATMKGVAGVALFPIGLLDRSDLLGGNISQNPGNPGSFAIWNRAKVLPFFLA